MTQARRYDQLELADGQRRHDDSRRMDETRCPRARVYRLDNLTSTSDARTASIRLQFAGKRIVRRHGDWKTNQEGMRRLDSSLDRRRCSTGNTLRYVRFIDDFPVIPLDEHLD